MNQLNIFEANRRRDKGIKTAADHAELVEPTWQDKALEMLGKYPRQEFMAEDVRAWAYLMGLKPAPHARAWGAVIQRANKEGLIEHIGYGKTANPTAHRTPASLWKKTG